MSVIREVMTLERVPVLLVEDTPDDERLAMRAFEKSATPLEVRVARDGAEALELLRQDLDQTPRLVFLDLKLPKISGLDVLKSIREHVATELTPVIILSSSDEYCDLIACYRLRCSAYVKKAVDYCEYMDAMRMTLDFWLRVNQFPVANGSLRIAHR